MTPVAQITAMEGGNAGNAGAVASEIITYLYTDHLMTNRLATDQNQNVIWRWEGEAFGNTPAEKIAGVQVNLRFPGQYFDVETNLHYNMMRYYDPSLGRYITSDPIGIEVGLNTYSYVRQNSLRRFDFTGLKDCCDKGDEEVWKGCVRIAGLHYRSCLKIANKSRKLCEVSCKFLTFRLPIPICKRLCTYVDADIVDASRKCKARYLNDLKECDNNFLCI